MKIPSPAILTVLLLFVGFGCTSTKDAAMAPSSDMISGSANKMVEAYAYDVNVGIPSRDFLFEDTLPDQGYGAYGYCLFTKRPDEFSRNRFIKFASAYLAVLEHTYAFESIPREELMPTYWLLKAEASEIVFENTVSAESLVDFYDYSRAKILLRSIAKGDSEGPILAAWQQTFEAGDDIGAALIFDLSTFSDEDMERAIQIWTSRIVKDPSYWNNGFKLVKFREEFRNFLQRYGEQVLAVITPGE